MAKKANHFWIEPDALAQKGYDYCSDRAQWLWFKVMLLLHNSERYGHLTRDGKAVTDEQAARRLRLDVEEWIVLRDELLDFGLLKRTGDGILYAPELIAQAEWRAKGAKRQNDFQKRKRGDKSGETNGEYNDEYNADITPDITPNSRPNFKLQKPSSFPNGKKEGGGKPPPADFDSANLSAEQKTEAKLDELQAKYPDRDVRRLRLVYLDRCTETGKSPKWQIFERSYLQNEEFEPMAAEVGGGGYTNPRTGKELK